MTKEFEETDPRKPKLSTSKRIQLATIESSSAAMIVVGNKLEKYYTDFIGMRPGLFGTAHLLYAFVNSINDPLLGYVIDHSSDKQGRSKYRIFLLGAMPLFLIGMMLQLIGQPHWSEALLFLCVFLGYSIFDTGMAAMTISAGSIVIQSVKDDSDRGAYVGLRLTIKAIFGVAGFLLPSMFLTGNATRVQVLLMFCGFAVFGFILYCIPVSTLKIPVSISQEAVGSSKMRVVLKQMLSMKTYRIFICMAFLITGVAMNQELFLLYFADDVAGLHGLPLTILSGLMLPFLFLTSLSAGYLIKKFGVKLLTFVVIILIIFGNVITLLDINLYVSIVGLFLAVIAGNFWYVLRFSLSGRIMDEYARIFGERNEGMFMGVDAIFNAPAVSLVLFAFSWIIDLNGYIGTADIQTPQAINAIRMGTTLISIICCSIALVLLFFLPIQKDSMDR